MVEVRMTEPSEKKTTKINALELRAKDFRLQTPPTCFTDLRFIASDQINPHPTPSTHAHAHTLSLLLTLFLTHSLSRTHTNNHQNHNIYPSPVCKNTYFCISPLHTHSLSPAHTHTHTHKHSFPSLPPPSFLSNLTWTILSGLLLRAHLKRKKTKTGERV